MKRIIFLKSMAYNAVGDIVRVIEETDNALYYYDDCHRWCYQDKNKEKIDWKYYDEDNMTKEKYNLLEEILHRLGEMNDEEIAEWILDLEYKKSNL
jgi:uncharacterized protein YaaW (UPF0174 family)